MWDVKKVISTSGVISQAKMHGKTVHVVNLMDHCRAKNAELAQHRQKYKGRVVLRGDNVTDEEGYRAAFPELSVTDGSGKVLGHFFFLSGGRGLQDSRSYVLQIVTSVSVAIHHEVKGSRCGLCRRWCCT